MSPPRPRTNLPAELLTLGYSLSRKFASGSTAEIYDARHVATGRRCAVKVSRLDVADADRIIDRMQTEWNVGRGLRHPNLVEILDGGQLSDGRAWLAMERLVGDDLSVELALRGRLEPLRAVHMARQICEALQVIHRRGAVHRDIKPDNVFVLRAGHLYEDHVKLIDLGVLALPTDDPERQHGETGQFIVGTPLYLAPEQATGELPDERTDLYALGGVLYHMLGGHPPFDHEDPTEVVARHVNDEVEPLDRVVPELPARLVALVHQCLAKTPQDRPADAAAVITMLDACARDLSVDLAHDGSLRSAPLPEVPASGHSIEWLAFVESLVGMVGMFWHAQPPARVAEALKRAVRAGKGLDRARTEADRRRKQCDEAARERIEQRDRLQRRARKLEASGARLTSRRTEAEAKVREAEAAVITQDEQYNEALARLQSVVGRNVALTSVSALSTHHAAVDAILAARTSLVARLNQSRAAERRAVEALAALHVEEIDLRGTFADLDLDDQEDGARDEREAHAAAGARMTAQRFYERTALRLLLEYVQALAPALHS